MTLDFARVADRLEHGDLTFARPGELAVHVEPRTVWTPALQILDDALVDAANGVEPMLLFSMPPQEGKSERASRNFPAWLLKRNPDLRIASVSSADLLARRWGRAVRDDLTNNPDLGIRVSSSSSAANEWKIVGHDGGMITTSIGGSLTGRPVDVLIIDDPFKDMQDADSEVMRTHVKEWWQMVGSTRLPENAIVVVIQTRWHEDDLIGWMRTEYPGDFRYINIPAQCEVTDKEPVDPLGRAEGEFMLSARGRTREGWEKRKRLAGSRGWQALYQGRPSAPEGGIFKRDWWVTTKPGYRAVQLSNGTWSALGADLLMISVDCAFKDEKTSDYVSMGVWMRAGGRAAMLDLINARMDFPTTCETLERLCAKWPQATLKLVEDKANGPALISVLRKKIPGLVPFTPVDSKFARANAVAPFAESHSVEIPHPSVCPMVGDFVEQCAAFPNAAHDDMVDMMSQALHRLFIGGSGLDDFMSRLPR